MSIPSSFIIGPFTIIFKLTELNVIVYSYLSVNVKIILEIIL